MEVERFFGAFKYSWIGVDRYLSGTMIVPFNHSTVRYGKSTIVHIIIQVKVVIGNPAGTTGSQQYDIMPKDTVTSLT